jgi:hypothetical protein
VPAADGHDEAAAGRDRRPGILGDDRGGSGRGRIRVGEDLDLPETAPFRRR